jgi:iron complex transport system substrate-binding protein
MDMMLCVVDKDKNVVEFAGAKNSLIYIKNNEIYEIKSEIILQPGPAALTDGVDIIMNIIKKYIIICFMFW